ncbi:MAG TPA: hypothetical protein VGK00_14280 [Anaerolineales bacterium]
MPRFSKLIFRIILPLGLLLLVLAASRGEPVSAQAPAPTNDRLAKPTLPPNPSQADHGSQDYWLNCSPCHGDKGQGLTEEFRRQYPPEDQNCWLSGCHGRRPYPNGWTIPTPVPALIGPGALAKFANASVLEAYISVKMPFQKPGSLDEDTYWRLTAYLLRQNGYWSGVGLLDETSAERVRIPFAQPESSLPAPTVEPAPTLPQTPTPQRPEGPGTVSVRIISAGLLLVIVLGFFLLVRHARPS